MLLAVGSNSQGQLAVQDAADRLEFTRVTGLPRDEPPSALALGGNHSLVLANALLYAAGSNDRTQLGPGPTTPRTSFDLLPLELVLAALSPADRSLIPPGPCVIVAIAAAWDATFVQLRPTARADDVLLSMGANDWDELGLGNRGYNGASVHVVSLSYLTRHRPPGSYTQITSLAAGPRHVVLSLDILDDTTALPVAPSLPIGWGAARHGQLGSPPPPGVPPRTIAFPSLIPLPKPLAGARVEQVAVGRDHTALLLRLPSASSSTIHLLGSNKHGQVSYPPSKKPTTAEAGIAQVGCTWSGTCVLRAATPTRVLEAIGSNSHGQLGRLPTFAQPPYPSISIPLPPSFEVDKVACGSEHVLVLGTMQGGAKEVWGWGWNEHGNLGNGDKEDVWAPVRVWPVAGTKVERDEGEEGGGPAPGRPLDIWAGNATSWISVGP